MLYILKASRQTPLELKTDAVLYRPLKRKTIDFNQIKFNHLHKLRSQFGDTPGIRKLDQRLDITPVLSEETVFRTHPAAQNDFIQCQTVWAINSFNS